MSTEHRVQSGEAYDYVPPTCPPPRTLSGVAERWIRAIAASRMAVVLAALALVCVLIASIALRPVPVEGVDSTGPYLARCGITMQLFGHPSADVAQMCRQAFGTRIPMVTVSLAALLATVAALRITLGRDIDPSGRGMARGTSNGDDREGP